MSRFSERIGARGTPRQIQLTDMDEALRASLWNEITPRFTRGTSSHWCAVGSHLARYLFKVPTDTVPGYEEAAYQWVREHFMSAPWHEAYDILEALVVNVDKICKPPASYMPVYYQDQRSDFVLSTNRVLERELSGYRFVRGILIPISDPAEVAAVEEASRVTAQGGLAGAHAHIASALRLLGQKPTPDYRNSIKEAISAVESVVNVITQGSGNGVATAIEELSRHTEIHGALRAALKQLYGFSSDSDGVRHAIMDQATVGFDEAKFMLVACAAFVNFVVSKAEGAGLLSK